MEKLGKIALRTSIIWHIIIKLIFISLCVLSTFLNITRVNEKYNRDSITLKDNDDFQRKIESAKSYEEQQNLIDARISQGAYEIKYGKSLDKNEDNEFDQNPYKKWGGIIGSIFGGVICIILGFLTLKFLFKPLKNNFIKHNQYRKSEISLSDYRKNKIWTIINTIIITALLIIPTFGLILTLTFFQFNFTLRT